MSVEPPIHEVLPLEAWLRTARTDRADESARELQALREECARMRAKPEALRTELHALAYRFRQGNGARWCGYSSLRDYAAERLGVAPATFYRWAKAGDPAVGDLGDTTDMARGDPAVGHLGDETDMARDDPAVGSAVDPADVGATKASNPGPDHSDLRDPRMGDPTAILVSLRMDSRFAPYLRETLRLAGALIGSEVDDETKLAAILAEASSEVYAPPPGAQVGTEPGPPAESTPIGGEPELPLPAAVALRRLGFQTRQGLSRHAPIHQVQGGRAQTDRAQSGHGQSDQALGGQGQSDQAQIDRAPTGDIPGYERAPDPSASAAHDPNHPRPSALGREEAHELDLRMRRLIARRRRQQIRHEAQLLAFHQASAHSKLGYRRFDEFARDELGFAPSTTYEMLDRARRYRQEHPIAVARATGHIGAIQASLLLQLWRMGVPRGDLPKWIDLAARITVRGLRDRIAWAREQADADYRAWSLRGCPPPSDEEVRTARHSLLELAAHPEPAALLERRTLPWKRRVCFQWILDEDTASFLAQLIAEVQAQSLRQGYGICESWRALIILCHHARRAWSQLERPRSRREAAVLDRDDWRCAVPGCSSRRSLQRHHIVFASRGGSDADDNLITLCAFHHLIGVHQGILSIRGRATRGSEDLRFDLGLRPGRRPLQSFRGEHRVRPEQSRYRPTGSPAAFAHEPAPRYYANPRAVARPNSVPETRTHRRPQPTHPSQALPHRGRWAMLSAETPSHPSSSCPSGTTSG